MLQKLWSQTTRQLEPLSLAAGLIGGANAAGSILNPIMQGIQNKKNRKWAEKMYNLQRTHALQDWNMQNEYNSPTAQMARLKSAGLNPHLVYGDGTVANSSSAPRSADSPNYQGEAPVFDPRGLMSFVDVAAKEAQTNNTEKALELMDKEMKLKDLEALQRSLNIKTGELDYDTKSQLQKFQLKAAQLLNQKTESEIDNINTDWYGKTLVNTYLDKTMGDRVNLAKFEAQLKEKGINLTQKQIDILEKDKTIKDIEIKIRKAGGNPNDPAYMKILMRAAQELMKKIGLDWGELF